VNKQVIDAVINAVVSALADRINPDSLHAVEGSILAAAYRGRIEDGYLWGLIEQASHTLWMGASFESPAELNALFERHVVAYLVKRGEGSKEDFDVDSLGQDLEAFAPTGV